jgi:hypothetical protein
MFKKIGGVLVSLAPLSAFAEVPAAVTTAMTEMKADALVVAGAFLIAAIAITAFLYMKKAAH